MKTILITHPIYTLHEMGTSHPESPARLEAINARLQKNTALSALLHEVSPKKATDEDLLRVHTAHHIAKLKEKAPKTGYYSIDGDTVLNPHTLEAAYYAAGAGITAIDALFDGSANTAFCAVRPPGHHATANRAMGFCFFNNVAVAAAYAIEKYQLKQVLIVDFDVHHGNGTEAIFAHHEAVQMFGFYQHPLFPGAALSPEASNMHNVPVSAGAGSKAIRQIVTEQWLPKVEQLKPELLLFSAGFDAHHNDPLGQLQLTEEDFAWITKQLMQATAASTQGRVLSLLEGGYELSALSSSVEAHLQELADL